MHALISWFPTQNKTYCDELIDVSIKICNYLDQLYSNPAFLLSYVKKKFSYLYYINIFSELGRENLLCFAGINYGTVPKTMDICVLCCSVAKFCPTICNLMDCSTLGFCVLHYLLDFAQIHGH